MPKYSFLIFSKMLLLSQKVILFFDSRDSIWFLEKQESDSDSGDDEPDWIKGKSPSPLPQTWFRPQLTQNAYPSILVTKKKTVTPTESGNRPVKQFPDEKTIGEETKSKPKPKFVSESDNREELDFKLGK